MAFASESGLYSAGGSDLRNRQAFCDFCFGSETFASAGRPFFGPPLDCFFRQTGPLGSVRIKGSALPSSPVCRFFYKHLTQMSLTNWGNYLTNSVQQSALFSASFKKEGAMVAAISHTLFRAGHGVVFALLDFEFHFQMSCWRKYLWCCHVAEN